MSSLKELKDNVCLLISVMSYHKVERSKKGQTVVDCIQDILDDYSILQTKEGDVFPPKDNCFQIGRETNRLMIYHMRSWLGNISPETKTYNLYRKISERKDIIQDLLGEKVVVDTITAAFDGINVVYIEY